MSDPREGLPPCTSLARLENRLATLVDYDTCSHTGGGLRFNVVACYADDGSRQSNPKWHPEFPLWRVFSDAFVFEIETDDPDEAQAAFERGAEWVRTGEMA